MSHYDFSEGWKALFLDVDGVLNSTRSTLSRSGAKFKTIGQLDAIERLKKQFAIEDELPYGPSYTLDTLDMVAVDLINRLLAKEPKLFIVLSSSHRSFFCGMNYPVGGETQFNSPEHIMSLRMYLSALGIDGWRLHGITDRLHVRRGLEVRKYLEEHPEITHHAAVDDGGDFEKYDCTLVQTDATEGLSSKDFFALAKTLVIHESSIIF